MKIISSCAAEHGFFKSYLKIIIFILFAFISPLLSAQSAPSPDWFSLEQGKLKFRNGDYGDALLSFEDARRNRRSKMERMERDLIHFLSINEVRRLGDSLDMVETFAEERYHTAAFASLQELYYRVPKESLKNSAQLALEAIGKLKDFPEAEFWIGEVYKAEGELTLALSQFRKAYEQRGVLEDPWFAVELQYKISEILLIRQEYNEMIKVLDAIITEYDSLLGNTASSAVRAMNRTLENEGINRFLELYRYDNAIAEPAHRRLGFFYAVTGRPAAQQHLTESFLIQNTIIIDEIRRRRYDFVFTNLASIADEINKNELLISYVENAEYYKTVFFLASALYRNGKSNIARDLWTFLSLQPKAGEWHLRAVSQLRNPRLEPVIEMP